MTAQSEFLGRSKRYVQTAQFRRTNYVIVIKT